MTINYLYLRETPSNGEISVFWDPTGAIVGGMSVITIIRVAFKFMRSNQQVLVKKTCLHNVFIPIPRYYRSLSGVFVCWHHCNRFSVCDCCIPSA